MERAPKTARRNGAEPGAQPDLALAVGLLGPVCVYAVDGPRPVRGAKSQLLLALLALDCRHVVPSDKLVDALWGNAPPRTAEAGLRGHVSRVRGMLAAAARPTPWVVHRSGGYALDLDDDRVDITRWKAVLEAAASAPPEQARRDLDAALALWRGEPFGEVADTDALRDQAGALRESLSAAEEIRAEAMLRLGEHDAAIVELEALVRRDPFRERRAQLLMHALYRAGRQAEALQVYRDVRRRLVDEVGVEPGPGLQAVNRAVLEQREPSLGPAGRARRPVSAVESLPSWLASALATPLLGRASLFEDLLRRAGHHDAPVGAPAGVHLVLIRGEAGIGKTRLLAELCSRMSRDGARVLAGWCDPEGVVPFRPVMEAFRQIVQDVARSPTASPGPVAVSRYLSGGWDERRADPEADRLRLFEGMATLLHEAADQHALVLAVDDIHWLDPSSAALLRHLMRRPPPRPITLVACVRSDPAEHSTAWRLLAEDLRRQARVTLVDVPELDADASGDVVGQVVAETGRGDADALAERILPVTGGNPLFLREAATQMLLSGTAVDGVPVPETMRVAVTERLRAMSPAAHAAIGAASVVGREFSLDVVCEVTGRSPDDVLDALEEARSARLVDEVTDLVDRFTFRHALLRDAVHGLMPLTRRRRLHLAAGGVHGRQDDVEAVLGRAHHLLEAVPYCAPESAARAAIEAGDAALDRLAFEESARVLRRALDLERDGAQLQAETRFDLLMRLGRARAYRGDDTGGDRAFAAAAVLARSMGEPGRLALAALGDDLDTRALTPSQDRLDLLAEGLQALGEQETPLRVSLASAYVALGSLSLGATQVRPLADDTVRLARRLGEPLPLSKALLAWTTCTNTTVDPVERLVVATEALGLAEAAGHAGRAARARLTRIGALLRLGRADEAVAEHGRYRDLAESTAIPRALWHADVVAAAVNRMRGRFAEAETFARRALATGERADIDEAPMAFGVHRFFVHLHRGSLAGLRPTLDAYAAARPDLLLWRLGAALAAVAAGDRGAARQGLEDFLAILPGLDRDGEFWTDQLMLAGQLASDLRVDAVARDLRAQLVTCQGQFEVFGASSGTLGPVDRVIGLLDGVLGDHERACRRLSGALELCRSMRAVPWEVRTAADLVGELRAAGRAAEANRIEARVRPLADGLRPVGGPEHPPRVSDAAVGTSPG